MCLPAFVHWTYFSGLGVFCDLAAHHLPLSMQNSVTIITVIYSHENANVGDGSGSGEVW